MNHSDKPLRLTLKFGGLLSSVSVLYGVWAALRQIIWSQAPQGWASVATLIAFSTGVITAAIGILGLYVGHIFSEVKNRPKFVIWETTVN